MRYLCPLEVEGQPHGEDVTEVVEKAIANGEVTPLGQGIVVVSCSLDHELAFVVS